VGHVVSGVALAANPSRPGIWSWSLDPPLALALVFALLYWFGNRRTIASPRTLVKRRLRDLYFYAGLAVLVVALASPLDAFAEQLFWAHMLQHMLLFVVAPPLIVLARPWVRLWRAMPLWARQSLGRSLARGRLVWLRHASNWLGRPMPSFVFFCGVVLAWHAPLLFDATLSSATLHACEHTLFFATALMFWKQVIDSPPLHATLTELQRIVYLIGAMVVTWLLAVILALAPNPLYSPYAHQASRPGGISALADQQLAAGIMWVPGSVTFVIVLFVYLHRWLSPASLETPSRRLIGDH
jgi:putative membrane protein